MSFRARLWINGEWQTSENQKHVNSPYTGELAATVDQATSQQMSSALDAAHRAFKIFRFTPRFNRSQLLASIAQGIQSRRADLVERMVLEGGKPRALSEIEVSRAVLTFTNAAEEVKRWGGDVIPLDTDPSGAAYAPAVSLWKARGPVLAIAPFNFPLNLIAHKVAPALAAGCSIIVKPPPQDPGCAAILAEIFAACASREKIPLATLQVLSADNDTVGVALSDPRITTLSFTGSEKVGYILQQKAVGKKVILELGGNAGVIVHGDADLERAAVRCAFGGYAYAGQICISVQRVLVQKAVAEKFQQRLIAEIGKLKCGDPNDAAVTVGPLIDSGNADRILSWIKEAQDKGAKILCGGERDKNIISPVLLTNVERTAKISCEEAFGPVMILETYDTFEDAIAKINDSRFGLQAGVFTHDQRLISKAFEQLDVGGVIINEIPTYRADHMPYGGVKHSGLGREGVKYAMESYSERRTLVEWRSL